MITLEDLDRLKLALHPAAPMNIIEQCRIIHEAVLPDGLYPNNLGKVARHLEVSRNKVYKMKMIHKDTTEKMKNWLKTTNYQSDKSYELSRMEPVVQDSFVDLTDAEKAAFLREMKKIAEEAAQKEVRELEAAVAAEEVKVQ